MQSPVRAKERQERATAIYKLWAEEGLTYEVIGERYSISRQRVAQIIKWLRTPKHVCK